MFACKYLVFCGCVERMGWQDLLKRFAAHTFITVKRGVKKVIVLRELEDKFKCNPNDFFELFEEPERKPNVKYMINPSNHPSSVRPFPGGRVSACSDNNNPLSAPDEIDGNDFGLNVDGSGTLTMFCARNGHHYALTCCHVGFANDGNRWNAAFNRPEDIQRIRESLSPYVNHARNKQYYFVDNNENYLHLGDFEKCCFHDKCDILSIKVSNTTQIACKLEGIVCPDWDEIWGELYERVFEESDQERVKVEKVGSSSGRTNGYILPFDLSYEDLFQDAWVVRSDGCPFMEEGDSGSLVFFYDRNHTKQVFAYGVCEVDTLPFPDFEVIFSEDGQSSPLDKKIQREENLEMRRTSTGPYYICLSLDIALEKLCLLEAACFNNCGSQNANGNVNSV